MSPGAGGGRFYFDCVLGYISIPHPSLPPGPARTVSTRIITFIIYTLYRTVAATAAPLRSPPPPPVPESGPPWDTRTSGVIPE